MSKFGIALSLKQPWAALLVHGHKSIEVKRWPTARRGRILIHAARVPDPRPEVWARVPEGLQEAARVVGGIVGAAELVECRAYHTLEAFAADKGKHLNDPGWFQEPVLYGFVMVNAMPLPYPFLSRVDAVLPGPGASAAEKAWLSCW